LEKSFAAHPVLKGIDLDVARGECLAIVGPNGAGKTTLLRILATLIRPNGGSIQVGGMDLDDDARAVRQQIGFLSHQPLLYADLTAEENLRFYGQMYGVADLRDRIPQMLRQVGLETNRHDLVRTFSRGMRQRLSIARALLHDPPVLLMDEPYTGLDRQASAMLDTIFRQTGIAGSDTHTVILTTHDLAHGWQISHRVAMLFGGKIAQLSDTGSDLDAFQREYDQLYDQQDGRRHRRQRTGQERTEGP
jgi:heme ABC exporter ATP-binding subunit CcmA